MTYQLNFAQMLDYDAGQSGITVDVTLKAGGKSVSCEAKLDTGSTYCIFARSIGEQLDLEVESGTRQRINTVVGAFIIYLHDATLSVVEFEHGALVGFAEDEHFARNVLGRRGFLDRVRLGIVDYEGKLYLSRYDAE